MKTKYRLAVGKQLTREKNFINECKRKLIKSKLLIVPSICS